ncbi:MAG: Crp/Fnr family transcriptional regulator [Betaproteobacteria bacterium]
MSVPRRTHRRPSTGNTLLDKLLSLDGLERHLEPVRLDMQEELLVPGGLARRVFFPTTCVCSILIELKTGQRAEIGTVGNEGFVGIPAVLRTPATELALVQIPGDAYAMKAQPFQNALERNRELYQAVVRYIGFAYQVAQQVNACNAYHTVDQRLARWLLVCADRARRLQFEIN